MKKILRFSAAPQGQFYIDWMLSGPLFLISDRGKGLVSAKFASAERLKLIAKEGDNEIL